MSASHLEPEYPYDGGSHLRNQLIQTRAAVLHTTGNCIPYAQSRPLMIESVRLSGPGAGEVLVQIAAAGLCHSDLSVIDGQRPRVLPMVLGHEASGVVCEVGPDVRDFAQGDHVVFSFVPVCGRCLPCLAGRAALCENGARANAAGTLLSGTRPFRNCDGNSLHQHLGISAFSEHTIVAQESLIRIYVSLSLQTAAPFGCAALTGVGAVLNTARVESGASVVIFGLGGVGLSTVMGARVAGANPIIAVDVIPAKLSLALACGATHALDGQDEAVVTAICDITNGGADYAFESVGSEVVLARAYQSTRRGGTTVTMGLPHPARNFCVPAVSLVTEERTVKGSYMGSAVPRRDVPRYIRLHQAGLLPVEKLLTRTIELDDINGGFDALASGEAVRQLVRFSQ